MPLNKNPEIVFMGKALQQARRAFLSHEVPVGAVIVREGKVIGRGYNQREKKQNPLLHAEIIAIDQAARKLGTWRLSDCTLYVTLEPCLMCYGAIVLARLKRLVYAANDPKTGACGSAFSIPPKLNHYPQIHKGVLVEESSALLKEFFQKIRKTK